MKKKKKTKFQTAIDKGDKELKKGKPEKALKHYREAQKLNPEEVSVYDKLIESLNQSSSEWTKAEFAESLQWTMKKQELEDPRFKRVHASLEPEWQKITTLIKNMLGEKDKKKETEIVEKIVAFETTALYPLVETLLSFKHLSEKRKKKGKNDKK